jgi:hypothetical protein
MSEAVEEPIYGQTLKGAQYPSLEMRLAATENRPSGFDYLRIILAILIVGDHTIIACLGMEMQRWLFSGGTSSLRAALFVAGA